MGASYDAVLVGGPQEGSTASSMRTGYFFEGIFDETVARRSP
jgi:hypothetical protein